MAKSSFPLPNYLHAQEEQFRAATRQLQAKSNTQPLSTSAEWLLDNFYLVQQTCRQIREDMPSNFYRQLPKRDAGPLQDYPRVYAIAQKLIVMRKAHLDLEYITRFVHLYQNLTQLTMGELWALPVMLRLGLVEFLAQTVSRITDMPRDNPLPTLPMPNAINDDEMVANCITSLRMLASQDWQDFFESVSRIEEILRNDPAHVYGNMDQVTRDRYRKVIEKLAQATDQDEQSIASQAIDLAQSHAQLATPLAAHVGYYLIDAGREQLERGVGYRVPMSARARRWILAHPTPVYLGSIGLLTLIMVFCCIVYTYTREAGATLLQGLAIALLLLIPALNLSVSLVNWLITLVMPPHVLPKMDFEDSIPSDCKTLVVIPSLLSNTAEVKSLLKQVELHFLRSQDAHLYFALLTDLLDSPQARANGDDPLVVQVKAGIRALNEKYLRATSGPFYLFHRDPRWNPSEERWMGWERKRGKLHELNMMLRGGAETAFSVQMGDVDVLRELKYVITLDADTLMPREAAHRLVATLAHPLNRAEFDPRNGTVINGYTLLQPGIEITSTSVNRSRFTRIFAGAAGLDLYSRAVSNAYQDLFGEGSYVGKGIYEIDAFERSLAGRMPENALLSHDLIEGLHGRVGLVTDIVLYEDYPPHYYVYLRRSRRWIRGDWQLLPWLFPRVPAVKKGTLPNNLSIIGRWKILDNMLRSLLSPALLLLFVSGWLWLPGSSLLWTLVGGLSLVVPVLTDLVLNLVQAMRGGPWRSVFLTFQTGFVRWILALTFILYETLLTLSGVATTLVRLFITRKHMLEWTSYADTMRGATRGMTLKQVLAALLSTSTLTVLIAWANPIALCVALPLLSLWLLSPAIADWISRPIDHAASPLTSNETAQLRALARRTWYFFEQFVGPEDNWLPPDHFQEAPRGIIAHYTSPTNVGLLLLSTLAAYDLGYIGLSDLSARLHTTFESMSQLEKFRGHFLNWYDTQTLEPLMPRYVSTVDSGNLVASLRALGQGCQVLRRQSVLRREDWEGLLDTLSLFDEIINDLPADAVTTLQSTLAKMRQQVITGQNDSDFWAPLLDQLIRENWTELNQMLMALVASETSTLDADALRNLGLAADRTQYHLYSMQRGIDQLMPWRALLNQPPAQFIHPAAPLALREAWQTLCAAFLTVPKLEEIELTCTTGLSNLRHLLDFEGLDSDAQEWCAFLAEKLSGAGLAADTLMRNFENVVEQAAHYVQMMNFRCVFDARRQLFHIGYNVTGERLDNNYYDLLASEARIASFVTIAKNEVPPSHWLHLGRPLTQTAGTRGLLSWGGTMFEYLMPTLLMRTYDETLLQSSCLAAVDAQIDYGNRKNVPWGISESGYYAFDANQNYQYRTFGVPNLGFKRNLTEDLVIAPYASLLALSLRPREVLENIIHLDALKMLGTHGFYESIDFSPSRLTLSEKHAIVRSYMAHHQGMILLALVNYLHDNVMVRRFHSDPVVRSVELLLQEKVPYDAPIDEVRPEDARTNREDREQKKVEAAPWRVPTQLPAPQVHFLSNGRYGVLITSTGAGFSRWQDLDLTRWRADTTREDSGVWIYLQDTDNGDVWSATAQPTASKPESHSVQFYPHMAVFRRSDHGIGLTLEIVVAPEDDVEIRRISLTNHSKRIRRIAVTSYGEIILAPQAADARHPAFNKLFIESEYVMETHTLLFQRRPRSASEERIYLAHTAAISPEHPLTSTYETDRARFVGRGRTLRAPAALSILGGGLSGTTGATLDPVMALCQVFELQPHTSAQVSFITAVARDRTATLALAQSYQDMRVIVRAFDQARARAELELSQLALTTADLEQIEQLLSVLLYPRVALRANAETLSANRKGQPGLWRFSISGDYPILLVRINTTEDLALVQQTLQAHTYWRNRGIKIDLVILNQQGTTYGQELRGQLHRVLIRQNSETWFNRRGGIFTLYVDQLSGTDRVLLETAARAVLDGGNGSLGQQLEVLLHQAPQLPPFVVIPSTSPKQSTPPLPRPSGLNFDNGWGGFSMDGHEYVIYLEPGQWTPAPWINVIANPDFGFTVSETGSGYTWCGNSSENRLTPWSNDPVTDTPGEALYLRDEETAEVWSPTPLPCRAPAPYMIRHGAGYSIFEHHSHGLAQRLRLFVIPDAPVKMVHLRLENLWVHTRHITATLYVEWVLGVTRDVTQHHVVSEYDSDLQALLVRNSYNAEFGECVAFVAASQPLHGLTVDRTEFLGRLGNLRRPAALDRIGLTNTVTPGLDPCAALQLHIDLQPGETQEIFFVIGQGENREDALNLIECYQSTEQVASVWDQVSRVWDKLLGTVQVQTPDPAMNYLLNRWLLYQTLACRVWARSAFYQSSGAFGFRDQLQDVLALIHAAPHLTRAHILKAAQFQFDAGDVLHWWHPPSGRGTRTRFSDDLLWLPYVVAHYVEVTGDEGVLDEMIPFRQATPLEPGEMERYDQYTLSAETITLYEHCQRAIEKGDTTGRHGLPLMGGGDWNDGMNRVGIEGQGESVWLGWFLSATFKRFARLCERRGDQEQALVYRKRADELGESIEEHAWDGAWYRRAYYDDGTPIGSASNLECQIDSIAQAWAVLSGAGDPEHAKQAMEAVANRLVRLEDQLVLLLAPPFDQTARDPGYIKGYPPGIRENGAQYTHAALWVVWAFAELGQGERAEALFRLLNPIYHSDTPEKAVLYGVEPYVIAADVYSAAEHTGRGGWTWYTGSSGWMYRVGLEAILGIQRVGQTMHIKPCIPKTWGHYQVTYHVGETTYLIRVENPTGVNGGVKQIELDGIILNGNEIPLGGDGKQHQVNVLLGDASETT